ncbi:MAG: hypothetical protein JO092_03775 [Candidatus Eremiobacteraeota bacterium]|nr:hypothetical protein [Candidatus Eremiobacteraeota bacterium]
MIQAIFFIPYAVAIALLAAEIARWPPTRRVRTPRIAEAYWIGSILLTYVVQLVIVRYGATHASPLPPSRLREPLPTVFLYSVHSDAIEAIALICAALQSYALIAIYRSEPSRRLVAGAAAVMIVLSLAEPALTSADLYSNVGYAILGKLAYSPPTHPFPEAFRAINYEWKPPLPPSPYGPIWLAVLWCVTSPFATLLGKMMALRCFCAACFLTLPWLMRALGLPRRLSIVTQLNPALAMFFVTNAHNDVFALVWICGAAVLAKRSSAWAALPLAIAGLVKLPYVVLGLPVLTALRPVSVRFFSAAGAIAVVGLVSWGIGGREDVAALLTHARPMEENAGWHVVVSMVAIVVVLAALAGARRYRAAVWLLPPVGGFYPAFVYPWYLVWGLPYALVRHRVLAYFLVWLPLVSALVDQQPIRIWTILLVFPLLLVWSFRPVGQKQT